MTIERRDRFLTSLIRTKDPIGVLRGERTWSPLTETWVRIVERVPLSDSAVMEGVKAVDGETIYYLRLTRQFKGHNPPFGPEHFEKLTKEEINDPSRPWAGEIRYTTTSVSTPE